jgi:heme o synthase
MQNVARYDAAGDRPIAHGRTADFVTLTKPRLNSLVLVTTVAAYYLGGGNELPWLRLVHTIVGTALVAAAAGSPPQSAGRDVVRHRVVGGRHR